MYQTLRKVFRNYINSRSAPDFLYEYFFDRVVESRREQLSRVLNQGKDLMAHLNEKEKAHWIPRIENVLVSEDNKDIPRVADAGLVQSDHLVMHNGIKVDPLSYYSFPMLKMLRDNKGVHEPQEEKIFQEVLKSMQPNQSPVMLELGAYWAFYSIWFQTTFPDARNYMVEPDRSNLTYGKVNFQMNNMKGKFIHAGIGKQRDHKSNITSVDEICTREKIDFIDLLHSDIQGFELDMLHGSRRMLSENRVGYIFVSTHSNELHENCQKLLKETYGFSLVASVDLDESYSWDGILVMKNPEYPGIEKVSISNRRKTIKTN